MRAVAWKHRLQRSGTIPLTNSFIKAHKTVGESVTQCKAHSKTVSLLTVFRVDKKNKNKLGQLTPGVF